MEYLVILLVLLVSAIIIKRKYRIRLYKSKKEGIMVMFVFSVVGILWDHFAIYRGHWSFPGPGLIGIKIGLMPLEEYLFILILPFWVLIIYKAITRKNK